MRGAYGPQQPLTDAELQIILKIIECLGGVLGFRPVMDQFIPDEKQALLLRAIHHHDIQLHKDHLQHSRDHSRDIEQQLRQRGIKIDLWTQKQSE